MDERLDDGFFLPLRFNGEADSSESDDSSQSEDGGDGAVLFEEALALLLAGAFCFLVPLLHFINGEAADSLESEDGIYAPDSSESGNKALAFLPLVLIGSALAFLPLRLDGASSASSAVAATAAGGATVGASLASSAAVSAATAAGGMTVGTSWASSAEAAAATAAGGATMGVSLLASSAAAGAATAAGGATVGAFLASSATAAMTGAGGARAALVLERPAEGGGTFLASLGASLEGVATVRAPAALVERQRMGLHPTAGRVGDTDSEGGAFLAMTDI